MQEPTLWLALIGAFTFVGCWHSGDISGEQDTAGNDTESESSPDTGPDVDTDIDIDTDTDIESDSETDQDTGWAMPCGGQPEECSDIGSTLADQERGCCHGDVLYWCIECVEDDDAQSGLCIEGQKWLKSFDCQDVDGSCGIEGEEDSHATCVDVDDDSAYSCGTFTKFCEDIGDGIEAQQFGCCLAGFLFDCWDAGYVHFEDCVGTGSMCGYDAVTDQIDCIGE